MPRKKQSRQEGGCSTYLKEKPEVGKILGGKQGFYTLSRKERNLRWENREEGVTVKERV